MRWLYRNYCQGSAVGAFVRGRVRPIAWLLMGGCGASVLMGANLERSVVVVLTLLIFSALCVAFLWAFSRQARISAIRDLPSTGAVGEMLTYSVSARNDGKWRLRDVFLREMGDDPRPSEWEFLNLKEPGEEDRNFFDRKFAFYRWKWLTARGGAWRSQGQSESLDLEAGEVQKIRLSLMPGRRGDVAPE